MESSSAESSPIQPARSIPCRMPSSPAPTHRSPRRFTTIRPLWRVPTIAKPLWPARTYGRTLSKVTSLCQAPKSPQKRCFSSLSRGARPVARAPSCRLRSLPFRPVVEFWIHALTLKDRGGKYLLFAMAAGAKNPIAANVSRAATCDSRTVHRTRGLSSVVSCTAIHQNLIAPRR